MGSQFGRGDSRGGLGTLQASGDGRRVLGKLPVRCIHGRGVLGELSVRGDSHGGLGE